MVPESVLRDLDVVIGLRGEVNGWFEVGGVGGEERRERHRVWEIG